MLSWPAQMRLSFLLKECLCLCWESNLVATDLRAIVLATIPTFSQKILRHFMFIFLIAHYAAVPMIDVNSMFLTRFIFIIIALLVMFNRF